MIRSLFFFAFFSVLFSFACSQEKGQTLDTNLNPISEKEDTKPRVDSAKIKSKASEAKQFCVSKKFNTDYCILVDMSLHSGVNRFFVWDFQQNKITHQFLVGHGCGDYPWSDDSSKDSPKFSNQDGSHLSALGKYKIGERGRSDWGIHVKYLLHGLESTNSNALKRFIVFHSWDLMSDAEVFPKGSPEGWGCPTISNNAMRTIDPILQKTKKPVLFWIYK